MFERPGQQGLQAEQGAADNAVLLVHIDMPGADAPELLDEFRELAVSAGATVDGEIGGRRDRPDPKYFVGTGKAREIADAVHESCVGLVLFNHELSPSQERNLERLLKCRVLDRTGLILDIFAQRARSHEGKLQVELAQLRHLSTRLVRGWTHLERQKGGIGLRGPGETQLESDRRLIAGRIRKLLERLDKVQKQRNQGRQARDRSGLATVSLVGYTNAGKSTLFNALTGSEIYAADQLFATLDPTLRRLSDRDHEPLVLADTVGFIRDLPHELVAAFRATLEETRQASLLLHVIDAADPERGERRQQVQAVLEEIGAEEIPQIEIMNKIDCCEGLAPRVDRDAEGVPVRVWLSAKTGEGLDELLAAIDECIAPQRVQLDAVLPPQAGALRARLYELSAVTREENDEQGAHHLSLNLSHAELGRLRERLEPYLLTVNEVVPEAAGEWA